jgi:hypothetical protein
VCRKSGQASTTEPADADVQGEGPLVADAVSGKRVDCHVLTHLVVLVQMTWL